MLKTSRAASSQLKRRADLKGDMLECCPLKECSCQVLSDLNSESEVQRQIPSRGFINNVMLVYNHSGMKSCLSFYLLCIALHCIAFQCFFMLQVAWHIFDFGQYYLYFFFWLYELIPGKQRIIVLASWLVSILALPVLSGICVVSNACCWWIAVSSVLWFLCFLAPVRESEATKPRVQK